MKFEWHEVKAESNLNKHGVSFKEAQSAFYDPYQENIPDKSHSFGEPRYLCVGLSERGRVLAIVYTERDETIRIISAREATKREEVEYYAARSNDIN
jgi:uncharacterized protein